MLFMREQFAKKKKFSFYGYYNFPSKSQKDDKPMSCFCIFHLKILL